MTGGFERVRFERRVGRALAFRVAQHPLHAPRAQDLLRHFRVERRDVLQELLALGRGHVLKLRFDQLLRFGIVNRDRRMGSL